MDGVVGDGAVVRALAAVAAGAGALGAGDSDGGGQSDRDWDWAWTLQADRYLDVPRGITELHELRACLLPSSSWISPLVWPRSTSAGLSLRSGSGLDHEDHPISKGLALRSGWFFTGWAFIT